jgi:hypothetical protein
MTLAGGSGDPAQDAVIEAIEGREQAALHERYLATEKAARARREVLAAARAGDGGALHSALIRLVRHAHAAGGHERTATRCAAQLAVALDPDRDDTISLDRAVTDATEAIVVAQLAAERRGSPLATALAVAAATLHNQAEQQDVA